MAPRLLSDDDQRILNEMSRFLRRMAGPGVTNTPRGLESKPVTRRRGGQNDEPSGSRFMAVITGSTSRGTNQWAYAWSEIVPSGDSYTVKDGGRSGTTGENYAVNLVEANHTSTYAWGVDVTGTDYSGTSFAPLPVGGGGTDTTHKYDEPVDMIQCYDENGDVRFYFFAWGSHDGDC